MIEHIFLATTGNSLARAECIGGEWQVENSLDGTRVNCLVSDPLNSQRIYAGTQNNGILVSNDSGKSWEKLGMEGIPVKSLAVDPHHPSRIFAGCKSKSIV